MISILDAIDDPKLFSPWFRDPATWHAWHAFLAALFGLPMSDAEQAVYRACTGRADLPSAPAAEAWLAVGRRGGKSMIMSIAAVFLATFRDYRPFLQPGERATIPIIAADRAQARVIFGYIRGLLTGVPMLARLVENEKAESFDLINQVSIEIRTASYRTARGYSCPAVICDEIAFWATDERSTNPDSAIIDALRPSMAQFPNSMLICASSPYAKRGELWENFKRYYGQPGDILVWRAATRTMNPSIKESLIARALEKDPEAASAEYLAEFRSDISAFVQREVVEACIESGVREHPPQAGKRYSAFCDPSGGSSDSFTLAVSHLEKETVVIDAVREIPAPFSPDQATAEIAATIKAYGLRTVTGDRYAGEWVVEAFRKVGITYNHSEQVRSELYLNFLPRLNSRTVSLLDHPKLVNQICGLERRTGRGRDVVDHSPGGHDDVANSVAGAVAITKSGPSMSSMPLAEFMKRLNSDNYQVRDGVRQYVGQPSRFIPHPTKAYRQ